jgi:hypothetical protein
MTVTAADYAWFEDRPEGLFEAYCLTLARGLAPEEFLARVGARPRPALTGVEGLFAPSMELWDRFPDAGMLIGVTTVPGSDADWALGLEVNGFLGVTPQVAGPLSAGTLVVSHFRNVEAVSRFLWAEDGGLRLSFEPLFPDAREGTDPDALLKVMQAVGFDLSVDGYNLDHPEAAAFALAEHLTGVRVTADMLEQATYACGVAPAPSLAE